jgi:HD superfamily phosphohydrolase
VSEKRVTFIYDELHGYIRLEGLIRDLVSTRAFQRLRRVKQLPFAWYVYPGATHTRFSHSLGTEYIAETVGRRLAEEGYIARDDVELVRAAALLHDIGHAPFSHSLEPLIMELSGLSPGELTEMVITQDPEISEVLGNHGISPGEVSSLLKGRSSSAVLNSLVSGDLDVDRLDYLPRDAYHTGVAYGRIDLHRIVSFLVAGEGGVVVPSKALNALESFYIARLHMYKAVYYHKTITGYQLLFRNVYAELVKHREVGETLGFFTSAYGFSRAIREGLFYLWDDNTVAGLVSYTLARRELPQSVEDLAWRLLSRRGYKAVLNEVKLCWSYRDIASRAEELRVAVESYTSLTSPKVVLFLDAVQIYDPDKPVGVIVGGREVRITEVNESIIGHIPPYVCFLRLYTLPEYEEDTRRALEKFLRH